MNCQDPFLCKKGTEPLPRSRAETPEIPPQTNGVRRCRRGWRCAIHHVKGGETQLLGAKHGELMGFLAGWICRQRLPQVLPQLFLDFALLHVVTTFCRETMTISWVKTTA